MLLGLLGVCGVETRSARWKRLMRQCVSDNHLERLKVRVTNNQIGGFGPPDLDKHRKNVQRTQEWEINSLNINAFLEMKCQVMKINNSK